MKFTSKTKNLLILIVLILIILSLNFWQDGVKNFFYLISQPIQRVLWQAGDKTSDFFASFHSRNYFQKEIEKLRLEKQKLLSEITSLKELKRENEILREALGLGLQEEFKLTLVEVIAKDVSQDFILVNKGQKDGIVKNLPLITEEKVLCGRISKVYQNFSKVELLTNKKSSFDVNISEREIFGIAEGKGELKLFLKLIPQDKELKEGDILVTTALGATYPAGLLVGKILNIKRSDIEPFQTAEVNPFFDINNLDKLFIITEF